MSSSTNSGEPASASAASLSPRPMLDKPTRVHVLDDDDEGGGGEANGADKAGGEQVRIIRPTPRRPQQQLQQALTHPQQVVDLKQHQEHQMKLAAAFSSSSSKDRRSLTDPRQLRSLLPGGDGGGGGSEHSNVGFVHANPVKLRSLSPGGRAAGGGSGSLGNQSGGVQRPERDAGHGGFVTSVTIDKTVDEAAGVGTPKEDQGYRILSSKDEEAERDGSKDGRRRRQKQEQKFSGSDHSVKKTRRSSKGLAPQAPTGKAGGKRMERQLMEVKSAFEQQLKLSAGSKELEDEDEEEAEAEAEAEEAEKDDLCQHSSSSYSSDDANSFHRRSRHNGANFKVVGAGDPGSRNREQHHEQHPPPAAAPPPAPPPPDHPSAAETSADEFVWIDSHNRLVELQQLPWTSSDVSAVSARALGVHHQDSALPSSSSSSSPSSSSERALSADALPRASYYLQRALVRMAREAQRLAKAIGRCGKREVATAIKIVLSPTLAVAAVRGCLRSAAMFAVAGEDTRQSKSERAGLTLRVGRMHQWMCLVKVGKFVHPLAAVYLTAAVETILEELVSQCASTANTSGKGGGGGGGGGGGIITAVLLEQVIASRGDLWGLFQPYAHLSSSRIASGTLVLSPCLGALLDSRGVAAVAAAAASHDKRKEKRSVGQILLTTCVGSTEELEEMVLIAGGICHKAWQQGTTKAFSGSAASSSSPPPPLPPPPHLSLSNSSSSSSSLLRTASSSSSSSSSSPPRWNASSIAALYHFMRCSQLEYVGQADGRTPIQELVYERPYLVLPPVVEWVRCAHAFAAHRVAAVVDTDDVAQAARVLLPGCDCPPRPVLDEPLFSPPSLPCVMSSSSGASDVTDEHQVVDTVKRSVAFQLLLSGRRDLIPHAIQLLPQASGSARSAPVLLPSNSWGLNPLHVAAARGDLGSMRALLEAAAGADAIAGVGADEDTRQWTALTYAALAGQVKAVKFLLDRGASVDGSACSSSETPLQVASGAGHVRVAELLIAHGASPFATGGGGGGGGGDGGDIDSGLMSRVGCPSPVSVAAIHGHRRLLHVMVTQSLSLSKLPPPPPSTAHASSSSSSSSLVAALTGRHHDHHHARQHPQHQQKHKKRTPLMPADEEEVLSLEEILAEGAQNGSDDDLEEIRVKCGTSTQHHPSSPSAAATPGQSLSASANAHFSKTELRRLQEAMYHAAESAHLELALDLRNLGVPWTAHTWVSTLRTAHDSQVVPVINEILQDFAPEWVEEFQHRSFFCEMGLPLLFSIFKACKNEGTILILADILAVCFGRHRTLEMRRDVASPSSSSPSSIEPSSSIMSSRIDPKFVNNPELSDVQFRVEGRIFYAHKLALISASPRFQSMLNSRFCEGSPPVLQINDIRYDIFHLVMTYLYNGGLGSVKVNGGDVLELMAAANFFQLPGLLRHCEDLCAPLVDLDNIVSYYIHAKVYQALDLLRFCEGFLLKNLVALLTYDDDAVKRLLFGKKLQNHDVLGGMLRNLQHRVRERGIR